MQDVRVFGIQDRRSLKTAKLPWIGRWSVAGRQRSRSFRTRAEADRYRSKLLHAKTVGETFDTESGEPLSWQPEEGDTQVHLWVRRWLAEQWPEWRPRTRVSAIEALARFVPLAAHPSAATPPPGLRRHLYATLPPDSAGEFDPSRSVGCNAGDSASPS